MKNRIKNKLRSRRGASITFALLLFVVCAVLCSVVLAAATSASGRMSRIAEVDQRYYAVTSAAELLIDEFQKNPSVSVVEEVKTDFTTTYTNGTAGEPVEGTPVTTVYTQIGNVKRDLDTIKSIQEDAAKNIYNKTAGITDRKLSLASTGSGLSYDALAVTVLEKMDGDGSITLTLYNTYNSKGAASSEGERYTMELSFGANKSVTTSTKSENVSTTPISATSYQVKGKTTKITTTTLKWKLTGMKTVNQGVQNGG